MKKLADIDTPLANFFASGVLALGHRLGPILWQLPPNLGFNPERSRPSSAACRGPPGPLRRSPSVMITGSKMISPCSLPPIRDIDFGTRSR